ncbi:zincin [Polyplosphaeria fusca]|uniref:Zincin n=1 Tax=Polyplosphaeria fusca TaxID=682080 RepID=A0A9P4QSV2_9PLEO|nr:zincin [Polyplosphaeria fusca]
MLLLGISSALASPALLPRETASASQPTATAWSKGAVTLYPIHASCNATERAQLAHALHEAETLARHAADHILRWGNSSSIYKKYFGNAPIGEPVGWYENVVNGDKDGVLFRCDNPDGNCEQDGWAGHWRGENATSETVICPLSYELRRPLEAMCGFGWDVANGATNFYFASDLLHRLYHVPKVGGYGIVEHYAGEYDECLELAETNSEEAVRNSDSLQYFALEAYAYDIAIPGEGCAGKWTATSSEVVSQSIVPSVTASEVVSITSSAAQECHTHSDGTEHCT